MLKRALRRWLQTLGFNLTLGQRGENAAAKFLRQQGFRILARNLRIGRGEIDILAETLALQNPRGCRALVIVEVKTGTNADIRPEEHVNPAKQKQLATLASLLVQRRREFQNRPVRFDVIGVQWPDATARGKPVIRHHVNAFEAWL